MNNYGSRFISTSDYVRMTPLERMEFDRIGGRLPGGFDPARYGPPPVRPMQTLAQAYNNPSNAR